MYICTVVSHITGVICSLTDNTLSSTETFVSFTARVTPPAKPCLPAPRAPPCQDIDRRHRARQLRPGQQGLDARLHTNVVKTDFTIRTFTTVSSYCKICLEDIYKFLPSFCVGCNILLDSVVMF